MTDSKPETQGKISRWWWLPEWLWHDIVRAIVGGFTLWVLKMVGQRLRKIQFGRVLRRLAIGLLNPRLLGATMLAMALFFTVRIGNQIMLHREAWTAGNAQILLLGFMGISLGATFLFAPNPRRRYSHINFKRSS